MKYNLLLTKLRPKSQENLATHERWPPLIKQILRMLCAPCSEEFWPRLKIDTWVIFLRRILRPKVLNEDHDLLKIDPHRGISIMTTSSKFSGKEANINESIFYNWVHLIENYQFLQINSLDLHDNMFQQGGQQIRL